MTGVKGLGAVELTESSRLRCEKRRLHACKRRGAARAIVYTPSQPHTNGFHRGDRLVGPAVGTKRPVKSTALSRRTVDLTAKTSSRPDKSTQLKRQAAASCCRWCRQASERVHHVVVKFVDCIGVNLTAVDYYNDSMDIPRTSHGHHGRQCNLNFVQHAA